MADDTPHAAPQVSHAAMTVDTSLVRQLAEVLDETRLTEIEVQDGERRIRIVRQVQMVAAPAQPQMAALPPQASGAIQLPDQSAPAATEDWKNHGGAVKSPMVGTAYLSAEPGSEPFVTEGATVKVGDTLVIIEAMKVMNPIAAPKAGRVVKICVQNEQPVEYDTPLVVIE